MGRGSSGMSGGGGAAGNWKASSADMPALSGSEKQVNWANDIRAKALGAIDNAINDSREADQAEKDAIRRNGFASTVSMFPTPASTIEAGREYVEAMKQATRAKDYIDNRDRFSARNVERQIYARAEAIDKEKHIQREKDRVR